MRPASPDAPAFPILPECSHLGGRAELLGRFAGDGRLTVDTGSIADGVPPENVRELALEARVSEVARADAEGGG